MPVERVLVIILLAILVGLVLAVSLSTALAARWLLRRNRVSPRVRTPAPLSWLWSWRLAARLHRRLRTCVLAAHACLVPVGQRRAWPALVELADALEQRAVMLDRQLVLAARAPSPTRMRALPQLAAEVAEVEALNERLLHLASRPINAVGSVSGNGQVPDLSEVRDRIHALDQAFDELADPAQRWEMALPAGDAAPTATVRQAPAPSSCAGRSAPR